MKKGSDEESDIDDPIEDEEIVITEKRPRYSDYPRNTLLIRQIKTIHT